MADKKGNGPPTAGPGGYPQAPPPQPNSAVPTPQQYGDGLFAVMPASAAGLHGGGGGGGSPYMIQASQAQQQAAAAAAAAAQLYPSGGPVGGQGPPPTYDQSMGDTTGYQQHTHGWYGYNTPHASSQALSHPAIVGHHPHAHPHQPMYAAAAAAAMYGGYPTMGGGGGTTTYLGYHPAAAAQYAAAAAAASAAPMQAYYPTSLGAYSYAAAAAAAAAAMQQPTAAQLRPTIMIPAWAQNQNGYDAGARFDGIAQPVIPPAPPGVPPSAAQLAAMAGHQVALGQKKGSFLTGGSDGGYTFW